MHSWFFDDWSSLGTTAAKGVLMYATALVVLRLAERRTLAQWTIIDFAAAVAVGAIVGRTTIADQSYAVGAVALVTIVAVHRGASLLRFNPVLGKLADHRIRVLVHDGEVRQDQLRMCGLTVNDLFAELRMRGIVDLADVAYVLYEAKGGLTVVRRETEQAPLVRAGVESSVGFDRAVSPSR